MRRPSLLPIPNVPVYLEMLSTMAAGDISLVVQPGNYSRFQGRYAPCRVESALVRMTAWQLPRVPTIPLAGRAVIRPSELQPIPKSKEESWRRHCLLCVLVFGERPTL